MGTEGMKYSLVSREVIADSIETVAGCEGFDGLVAIGGCDKNMPGCLMAHRPVESSSRLCLRRHHSAGHVSGQAGGCRLRVRSGRAARGGQDQRSGAGRDRGGGDSGTGFLRRHVHGQHHGLGRRSPRHEPAEQFRASRHFQRQDARLRGSGRRRVEPRPSSASARATS